MVDTRSASVQICVVVNLMSRDIGTCGRSLVHGSGVLVVLYDLLAGSESYCMHTSARHREACLGVVAADGSRVLLVVVVAHVHCVSCCRSELTGEVGGRFQSLVGVGCCGGDGCMTTSLYVGETVSPDSFCCWDCSASSARISLRRLERPSDFCWCSMAGRLRGSVSPRRVEDRARVAQRRRGEGAREGQWSLRRRLLRRMCLVGERTEAAAAAARLADVVVEAAVQEAEAEQLRERERERRGRWRGDEARTGERPRKVLDSSLSERR